MPVLPDMSQRLRDDLTEILLDAATRNVKGKTRFVGVVLVSMEPEGEDIKVQTEIAVDPTIKAHEIAGALVRASVTIEPAGKAEGA